MGDSICFQGYVMDKYCIDRGTMLDNPSKETLVYPELHSVHCLVDVPICYSSGFEMLKDPEESGGVYCRAYELDAGGNDLTLQLGRSEGTSCSTCEGDGSIVKGLRVRVVGTSGGVGEDGVEVLNVASVDLATEGGCDGYGGETVPSNLLCEGGAAGFCCGPRDVDDAFLGLLAASGSNFSEILEAQAKGYWFKLHRAIQCTGLLLAVAGFLIAITQFDVFTAEGVNISKIHGTCGVITMALGILQPINAYFRPHPEPASEKRVLWEKLHKNSGRFALGLAFLTILLGTTRVAFPSDKIVFQIFYVAVLILLGGIARKYQLEGKVGEGGKVVEIGGGDVA